MGNQYVDMGLSAPVNVTWEVTFKCNLSCIHCLSDSGKKRKGELNTEQCRQVIDALSDMKVFQFNIGGGEPFMRPDFLDLMDHAHEKGMVTCISTNGTPISTDNNTAISTWLKVSIESSHKPSQPISSMLNREKRDNFQSDTAQAMAITRSMTTGQANQSVKNTRKGLSK